MFANVCAHRMAEAEFENSNLGGVVGGIKTDALYNSL